MLARGDEEDDGGGKYKGKTVLLLVTWQYALASVETIVWIACSFTASVILLDNRIRSICACLPQVSCDLRRRRISLLP